MLLAPLVARSHPAVRAAQDNYADTTKFICATKTCVLNRNTFVNRSATPPAPWPAAAQAVMAGAGVRPEARSQMHPDAAGSCRSVPGLKTDDMAVTALALAVAVLPAAGLDNGLSLTPPMGFVPLLQTFVFLLDIVFCYKGLFFVTGLTWEADGSSRV